MTELPDTNAIAAVRALAIPLREDDPYDALLDMVGDADLVLLGEASHGTHEFYRERARITQRLLAEKQFQAVAIEGDWPDAYRVNRYVRGAGSDASAAQALEGFKRFPAWMWRNTEVVAFVEWQRAFNERLAPPARTGFYGLDLYSMNSSMAAVLEHLEAADPEAARQARERYGCFDRFGEDSQVYGLMTGLRGADSCEQAVRTALADLRRRAVAAQADSADTEAAFDAAQNALLVKNAEAYYRSMYLSDVSSWNLRDLHMAETLGQLQAHLQRQAMHGPDRLNRPKRPKTVVWAHNAHLGDARATEMGQHRSELNLGQLVRERHGNKALLVGFSTHHGSVTAASDWGAPAQRMRVVPARTDSHEGLMHASGIPRLLLPLRGAQPRVFAEPRLGRAIGVVYRPETERMSHYFHAALGRQFDALIHLDTTRALEPLERGSGWTSAEAPATYPAGV